MRLNCLPTEAASADYADAARSLRLPAQPDHIHSSPAESPISATAPWAEGGDMPPVEAQIAASPCADRAREEPQHSAPLGLIARLKGGSMRRLSVGVTALSLAACSAMPVAAPYEAQTTRAFSAAGPLPISLDAMEPVTPVPSSRLGSNSELARDFLELSFFLESGRQLGWFSRFEGPISVGLKGRAPATAGQETARLVGRLRSEAGIAISTGAGAANTITIEFVSRRAMNSAVPNTACFVVPNVTSWGEFKANRRSTLVDWGSVKQRRHATVFIPEEANPQELRDCLHEETAQALGPLNDLYRLPDTVFNDDNFHAVLTRFDMMILKATYAPELRSGMSQPEALSALARALPRLNPAGGSVAAAGRVGDTPKGFLAAMSRAMGAGSQRARKGAAQEAIAIAASQGWRDTRTAFAYFALGRLSVYDDPATAVQAFTTAGRIYRSLPGAGIQAAHVDMQLAALALGTGQSQDAIALANRAQGAALKAENSALMATLALIRASAYEQIGMDPQAGQARSEASQWARYGFGSSGALQARAAEVAALARAGERVN